MVSCQTKTATHYEYESTNTICCKIAVFLSITYYTHIIIIIDLLHLYSAYLGTQSTLRGRGESPHPSPMSYIKYYICTTIQKFGAYIYNFVYIFLRSFV